MAIYKETIFEIKHTVDQFSKKHYFNGELSALHCHHYTTLYTQLAMDAKKTDILEQAAEESFYSVLKKYISDNNITELTEKISICSQYYAATGMGKMEVVFLGDDIGEVILTHSHLDQGWVKKFGNSDKPLNFITKGFISALFSVINNIGTGIYKVLETESIAMGDKVSRFKVTR